MTDLLILSLVMLGYGLLSRRLSRLWVSPAMAFVAAGLLLGQGGLGWLSGTPYTGAIHVLAEAVLVLVLFTDAVRIDMRVLRSEYRFPSRLLGIGLPVAVVLGAGAAWLILPGFDVWQAALVAAVLAPTDAALNSAVVTNRTLPVRIRQTLNVESGLNDGLALPLVLMFAALAASSPGGGNSAADWVWFAARQISIGGAAGVIVGTLGGWALRRADTHRWMTPTYQRLSVLALAALAFLGAETVTGNGFIAAFVSGLCFGAIAREQCPTVHEFAEREGQLLAMLTWTLFGAVIAGPRLGDIGWTTIGYAIASLALVRIAAVSIAMIRSRLHPETVLFLGWFGPRGLASILFALLVVERTGIPAADDIMTVVSATVLISVYAHGLTATPWAARLARRMRTLDVYAPEHRPTPEHHPPPR